MADSLHNSHSQQFPSFAFMNLNTKIKKACDHAEMYGGLNNSLWPYQTFSLTIGELLEIAMQGKPFLHISFLSDVKERVTAAYEHVLIYEQENESLWHHQGFSLSMGELLDAAMLNINPEARLPIAQKVEDNKKLYKEAIYNAKLDLETEYANPFKRILLEQEKNTPKISEEDYRVYQKQAHDIKDKLAQKKSSLLKFK